MSEQRRFWRNLHVYFQFKCSWKKNFFVGLFQKLYWWMIIIWLKVCYGSLPCKPHWEILRKHTSHWLLSRFFFFFFFFSIIQLGPNKINILSTLEKNMSMLFCHLVLVIDFITSSIIFASYYRHPILGCVICKDFSLNDSCVSDRILRKKIEC